MYVYFTGEYVLGIIHLLRINYERASATNNIRVVECVLTVESDGYTLLLYPVDVL